MALINCPECGKEMSDRAESCPQCGMPINEIKAALGKPDVNTPKIQLKEGKNGMPQWGWILIIVGSLLIVGGIVFFCFMGKSSDSEAVQEEAVQIAYPDITAQGVKPFFVGSSMYDIPAKGDFYDTILLEKRYNAFEECGELHSNGMTEKELLEFKKNWEGVTLIVESYGYAFVMKDNDTLIKMDFDENAVIHSIEVFSEQIKIQNGVRVGLSASEMFEKYNALFITPSSFNTELLENDEDDNYTTFELPHQPTNISVKAVREIDFEYKEQYENRLMEQEVYEDFDTLPLEAVKGSSVRSILIHK